MTHYKMSDVAVEVNDRENNPASSKYDRFVGLEHYVSGEVIIRNYGSTENLESTMKIFQSGDVLVARRNVYLKRASMVDFDGLTSGDSIVLRAKNPVIGRILPFVLNTDAFWDFADQYSDGTMSKRLSPKTLMTYEFDLPDEDELEKFADLLWAAIDTRESYQALLRQTDELVKSQFIELFAEKEYPRCKLSDVCKKITDGTHKTPNYQDQGIAFISAKNIVDGKLDFSDIKHITQSEYEEIQKRCQLEIGDLLMSKSGSLGSLAIVETTEPLGLFESLAIIKYDRKLLDGVFLKEQLRSDKLQEQLMARVKGVAVKHLHLNVISETTIIVPPLEEQIVFSHIVQQTDKSKFEIKKAIENTSALIKSLMQQDLTN